VKKVPSLPTMATALTTTSCQINRLSLPCYTDSLCMNRGNALVLARSKQLAVFNLQSGLDVYSLPDFTWTHAARYDTNARASQGLAQFKSGTHLISPTGDGRILVLDAHNATVTATLQNPCAIFLLSSFSTAYILSHSIK
jgi:hypothetical protein